MHRFDKIPPGQLYPLMLLCVGALMIGRALIRPFISPFANDALGACGLALTLCAITIDVSMRRMS